MFIYETTPIDLFEGMIPIEAYVRQIPKEDDIGTCYNVLDVILLAMKCSRDISLAKKSEWDGDVRFMHVFSLPNPDTYSSIIGFVWKQKNDGTTYICSPVKLPWISDEYLL